MRVTRITIDSELGIIELRTGPGGDGDYVLLPLSITPDMERYVTLDGPMADVKTEGAAGYDIGPGTLIADGGWAVGPRPDLVKAEAEELRVERGGVKYPSRSPIPPQDSSEWDTTPNIYPGGRMWAENTAEKCDGNCGAHRKEGRQ